MIKQTGADLTIALLERQGITHIAGIPGGANLPLYDALSRSRIRHILARHEQGAGHMAEGYAKVTGRVGVCTATSGPGATNLVTGLATAYMDSIPIVAITGQVHTHLIGNDAFQEADVVGITRSVSKHNYLVKTVEELPTILKSAFYIARTGRTGPVVGDRPASGCRRMRGTISCSL